MSSNCFAKLGKLVRAGNDRPVNLPGSSVKGMFSGGDEDGFGCAREIYAGGGIAWQGYLEFEAIGSVFKAFFDGAADRLVFQGCLSDRSWLGFDLYLFKTWF